MRAPGASDAHEAVPKRATLLVVEDDEQARSFFVRLLKDEGYAVEVAVDGVSALAAVANHAPDVVLLDVGLPELDGFEVCRRLKREAATRLTPIIFVTALHEREQRV